jgi:PEGA domain
MKRVIAVVACGFTVTACTSSWMPSFEMPSFGSSAPPTASLAVESDPPGAQASAGGTSCVTPCRLTVATGAPINVDVALNGYVPQSVPVHVVAADDPRLGSGDSSSSGPRLDPNPVYVELERAAPPPPAPHKKKKPAAKRTPTAALRTAPATAQVQAQVQAPSAPTTAVAASPAPAPTPAAAQPAAPDSAAAWPMPR